ncbi:DUF3027 domain-containing protein [Enemella evansiae]|nr:DUF3027 domain-containing protein [Enemella evansiae]PFG66139.1 Protein of unknown function (DUF3027) [Propionibacteriaceae bacterium ES.041]TDO86005.1 hypothetical protein C8D81_3886 [Enemella evansiae]
MSSTQIPPRSRAPKLDQACADAVDLAREAAEAATTVVMSVGEHTEVRAEADRVATHYFACTHPGYRGWQWAVTVARASRARKVTVDEVVLLPGPDALLSPAWVPWADRISDGDVGPGILMPTPDNDPRLEPGYTGGERAADTDPAEASQLRAVVAELGLGRERVLSAYGREEAAERWLDGDGGPRNEMTRQAPGSCVSCAYFVRLQGGLGTVFGVCANQYAPSDAHVVSIDHGCGAHSDVVAPEREGELPNPVWDTISLDDSLFD